MQTFPTLDAAVSDCNLSFPGCRWLVFDAVGTLIEPSPSVSVAYHQVGQKFGATLGVEEVARRFRLAFRTSENEGFPGGPAGKHSNDVIERARWRWIVGEVFAELPDPDDCYRELWDHFARPSSWRCFEDVSDVLRRLSDAGYRLAMASNFDRRLHQVCDSSPELKPIEVRVVSAEVGYRKPAPEFYASLIVACGCEPHEILMIGDSYENDVRGPEAAGLHALHLDRRRTSTESPSIGSLTEFMARFADFGRCAYSPRGGQQ